MLEAYEIGISLALQDGVSAGIALIRRDLAALDRAIAATSQNLAQLQAQAGRSPALPRSTAAAPSPASKSQAAAQPSAAARTGAHRARSPHEAPPTRPRRSAAPAAAPPPPREQSQTRADPPILRANLHGVRRYLTSAYRTRQSHHHRGSATRVGSAACRHHTIRPAPRSAPCRPEHTSPASQPRQPARDAASCNPPQPGPAASPGPHHRSQAARLHPVQVRSPASLPLQRARPLPSRRYHAPPARSLYRPPGQRHRPRGPARLLTAPTIRRTITRRPSTPPHQPRAPRRPHPAQPAAPRPAQPRSPPTPPHPPSRHPPRTRSAPPHLAPPPRCNPPSPASPANRPSPPPPSRRHPTPPSPPSPSPVTSSWTAPASAAG